MFSVRQLKETENTIIIFRPSLFFTEITYTQFQYFYYALLLQVNYICILLYGPYSLRQ